MELILWLILATLIVGILVMVFYVGHIGSALVSISHQIDSIAKKYFEENKL